MWDNHKKEREHMATLACVLLFSFLIYSAKRGIHWHGEGAQKMGKKGNKPNSDTKSTFRIQKLSSGISHVAFCLVIVTITQHRREMIIRRSRIDYQETRNKIKQSLPSSLAEFRAYPHQVRVPHLLVSYPSKIFFARKAAALSGPPTADLFIAAAYAFAFASLISSSSDCGSSISAFPTSLVSRSAFSSSSSEDEVSISETSAECFADSDSRSRRVSLPRLRQYQKTKRRTAEIVSRKKREW